MVKQECHSPGEGSRSGLGATDEQVHHRHMHVPFEELSRALLHSRLPQPLEHVVYQVPPAACRHAVLGREGPPERLAAGEGLGWHQAEDRGSRVAGCGPSGRVRARCPPCAASAAAPQGGPCSAQPAAASGGQGWGRTRQGATECSCWGGSPPPPTPRSRASGLLLLTLRKGTMSKIWMDQ